MCPIAMEGKSSTQSAATTVKCKHSVIQMVKDCCLLVAVCILWLYSGICKDGENSLRPLDTHPPKKQPLSVRSTARGYFAKCSEDMFWKIFPVVQSAPVGQ